VEISVANTGQWPYTEQCKFGIADSFGDRLGDQIDRIQSFAANLRSCRRVSFSAKDEKQFVSKDLTSKYNLGDANQHICQGVIAETRRLWLRNPSALSRFPVRCRSDWSAAFLRRKYCRFQKRLLWLILAVLPGRRLVASRSVYFDCTTAHSSLSHGGGKLEHGCGLRDQPTASLRATPVVRCGELGPARLR
jgi:hypothetical protein